MTPESVKEELIKLNNKALDLLNSLREETYSPRHVNIILRMALDGLEAVIPDSKPPTEFLELLRIIRWH